MEKKYREPDEEMTVTIETEMGEFSYKILSIGRKSAK